MRAFCNELSKLVDTITPITRFNALAALLWIHVTRARHERLIKYEYKTTSMGIAVDIRNRILPKSERAFTGNMAIFAKATTPIATFCCRKMVTVLILRHCQSPGQCYRLASPVESADMTAACRITNTTIILAIQEIIRTISSVDNTWVQRQLGYFLSVKSVMNTENTLRVYWGPDMYITSWVDFGAEHSWGIPGTMSNVPEFIRRTYSASDGGMIILPRKREIIEGIEAPYEVLVRLAREDMARLLTEEGGLAGWAERIVK